MDMNMNITEKKLFIVEFGEPKLPNFTNFRSSNLKPIYVIARDFNEAANKAVLYMEAKKQCGIKKPVIDSDGSLNNRTEIDYEIKVESVKLAAEEIIW
jgi:hypothetical protein